MGDLTKNFSRSEFKCPDCGRLDLLDDRLVAVLQRLRDMVDRPLKVVSGYRCCAQNGRVGGIRFSEHLFGRAADIPRGYARATQALKAGAVGVGVRDGWVIHVDVTPGRQPFVFNE